MGSYTATYMAVTMPQNSSMPSIGSVANNCTAEADARRQEEERTSSVSGGIHTLLTSESPEIAAQHLADSHSDREVSTAKKSLKARKCAVRKPKCLGCLRALRHLPKDLMRKIEKRCARRKEKSKTASGPQDGIPLETPRRARRGFEPRVGIATRNGLSGSTTINWSGTLSLNGSWNPASRNGSTLVDSPPREKKLEKMEEVAEEEEEVVAESPPKAMPLSESPTRENPLRAKSGKVEREEDAATTVVERKLTVTLGKYRKNDRASRFTEDL